VGHILVPSMHRGEERSLLPSAPGTRPGRVMVFLISLGLMFEVAHVQYLCNRQVCTWAWPCLSCQEFNQQMVASVT